MADSIWLSLEEASDLLGGRKVAPTETIRRWVWEGKLSGYRPGRHVLIKREDLIAFVESRKIGAGPIPADWPPPPPKAPPSAKRLPAPPRPKSARAKY